MSEKDAANVLREWLACGLLGFGPLRLVEYVKVSLRVGEEKRCRCCRVGKIGTLEIAVHTFKASASGLIVRGLLKNRIGLV